MNPLRLLALLLFCLLMLPLAAQDSQPDRPWLLKDGSKMEGKFLKLLADRLLIRDKRGEVSIPLEWLAPRSLEVAEAIRDGLTDNVINNVMMEFVPVGPGSSEMGAPKQLAHRQEYEPFRHVKITRGFHIKRTEVTWAEWNAVRTLAKELGYTDLTEGRNGYQGDDSGFHPVTEVSWWDAVKWCNAKSQIENKTPVYYTSSDFDVRSILKTGTTAIHWKPDVNGYRLPTEAEWEHAWYRGGHLPNRPFPDGWNCGNSNLNTQPVRTRPNSVQLQIHDMIGNVAEWCWDWNGTVTPFSHETDPRGPESGIHRISRGGSFADHPWCCTQFYRGDYSPAAPRSCFVGFRPVRDSTR